MNYAYLSDKGITRDKNEDFILINEDLSIFILADGMGGHSAGEVASEEACYFVMDYILKREEELDDDPIGLFSDAICEANSYIWDKAVENPIYSGMGTTMVLLYIRDGDYYVASIGDSRAYLYLGGELNAITRDHSWVQAEIDSGRIEEDKAKFHPYRNVITRCIGVEKESYKPPQFVEGRLEEGSAILLCSDGLHDYVDMEVVKSYIENYDVDLVAKKAVDLANENGGKDNCSIVIVEA